MMRCIYCLQQDRPCKGLAHVFPEALRQNGDKLPRGTVCDGCNNYLKALDSAVAYHPLVSLAIQLLGLPGKRGRARQRVGTIELASNPRRLIIPIEKPRESRATDGSRVQTVTPLFARDFDLDLFRRGLHHIAFNMFARLNGAEAALDSIYDPIRRYVREPKLRERWAYAQYITSLDAAEDVLLGGLYESDQNKFGALRMFQATYFVDLLGRGELGQFLDQTQPPGTEYVDTDYRPPRASKQGQHRFRMTIFLDDRE